MPPDERERLETLRCYEVLDRLPEPDFDELVILASAICKTPIAAITLIDQTLFAAASRSSDWSAAAPTKSRSPHGN